jgi:hypothetical protein
MALDDFGATEDWKLGLTEFLAFVGRKNLYYLFP